jgi:hypothetical protein
MASTVYQDDPERVREHLRRMATGDWFVFETFAADGSLAIGVALVVYERLTKAVADAAAQGLAGWHHGQGRNIALD